MTRVRDQRVGADDAAMTALLADLIRVPSPTGDESAMCALLAARLAANGWRDVRVVGRGNVVARHGGPGSASALLAYVDTAPAGDMRDPFEPALIEGGAAMRGRGACTKGGLAACIAAAEATDAAVLLIATSDDNKGLREVLAAVPIEAERAVHAEPTDLAIGIAARGIVWLDITVRGKPVHAGRPDPSVNPLWSVGPVLDALRRVGLGTHAELGPATIAPVDIRAERLAPLTPASVTIRVDRRLLPGESPESARDSVADALGGLEVEVTIVESMHPFTADPGSSAARCLVAAAHEVRGKDAAMVALPFATNAGLIASHGIPAIAFGPGRIADLGADERVSLDALKTATRTLTRFLECRA